VATVAIAPGTHSVIDVDDDDDDDDDDDGMTIAKPVTDDHVSVKIHPSVIASKASKFVGIDPGVTAPITAVYYKDGIQHT
jgi:hypothetical protein